MPTDLADAVAAHPLMQAQSAQTATALDFSQIASAEAESQPPEPLPMSSFADPGASRKKIPLAFPVLYPPGPSGRSYDAVYLRKLTVAQIRMVQANYARAKLADPSAEPDFQLVVDDQGTPLPRELLDLMEADDADALDEALFDFLPRRFRPQPASPSAA